MSIKEIIEKYSDDYMETNDCTVRALAVALGGNYDKAHRVMSEKGRKPRGGAHNQIWKAAFLECGFELDRVKANFDSKTILSLERELREKRDRNMYLISVRGHVAMWDGFATIDWAAGRRHRIREVYHVRPVTEPQMPVREVEEEVVERSPLADCIFVLIKEGSRDGNFRICIRENGKVRWLNTKYTRTAAEWAAENAADKRWISYAGIVNSAKELPEVF